MRKLIIPFITFMGLVSSCGQEEVREAQHSDVKVLSGSQVRLMVGMLRLEKLLKQADRNTLQNLDGKIERLLHGVVQVLDQDMELNKNHASFKLKQWFLRVFDRVNAPLSQEVVRSVEGWKKLGNHAKKRYLFDMYWVSQRVPPTQRDDFLGRIRMVAASMEEYKGLDVYDIILDLEDSTELAGYRKWVSNVVAAQETVRKINLLQEALANNMKIDDLSDKHLAGDYGVLVETYPRQEDFPVAEFYNMKVKSYRTKLSLIKSIFEEWASLSEAKFMEVVMKIYDPLNDIHFYSKNTEVLP